MVKLLHTDRRLGGQRGAVERAGPRGGWRGMHAIEGVVGGEQRALAIGSAAQGGEGAGLHRLEASAEGGMVRTAAEDGAASLGVVESGAGVAELLGQVAEAGVDVGGELEVVCD